MFRRADLSAADLTGANLGTVSAPATPCAAATAKVNIAAVRLDGTVLVGARMVGLDAREQPLNRAQLRTANLTSACLQATALDLADLTGVNLTNADLMGASLSGSLLANVVAPNAVLVGADLSGAILSNATLTTATLDDLRGNGVQITGGSLAGTSLAAASLVGASFSGVNLTAADLTGATANGSTFNAVTAVGAHFDGANLQGTLVLGTCDFTNANFSNAQMQQANISGVSFTDVTAPGVNLQNALLSQATFTRVDLTAAILDNAVGLGANFVGADLTGASIRYAEMSGATFEAAPGPIPTHLDDADLDYLNCRACVFEDVQMPSATAVGGAFSQARFEDCAMNGFQAGSSGVAAVFDRATFRRSTLTGARINDGRFHSAVFFSTDLSSADLREAEFDGSLVRDSIFDDANLGATSFRDTLIDQGTSFVRAEVARADFREATIEEASFRSANLYLTNFKGSHFGPSSSAPLTWSVDFVGASLRAAAFNGADIAFTDFSGAHVGNIIGIEEAKLYCVNLTGLQSSSTTDWATALTNNSVPNSCTVCQDGRLIEDFSPRDCSDHGLVKGFLVGPRTDSYRSGFTSNSTGIQYTDTNTGLNTFDPVWNRPSATCTDDGGSENHYFNVVALVNPTDAPILTTVDVAFAGGGNGSTREYDPAWDSDLLSKCVKGSFSYNGSNSLNRILPVDVPARGSKILVMTTSNGGATISGYTFQVANGLMWEAEGPEATHTVGAVAGAAWAATTAELPGFMMRGPNTTTIPAGNMVAVFRVQTTNVTGTTQVVYTDVYNTTLASRLAGPFYLRRQDFTTANTYKEFELPFTAPGNTHSIELRTYFMDTTNVLLDRVYVRRAVP